MGSAVLEASQEAIQQMVVMAADVLKVKVEEIQTVRGGVRCGEVQLNWSQVISKFYALPDGEVIGRSYIRKSGKFAALPVFWEAAATGVEISVDEETGKITMEKLATVGDVGLGDQSGAWPKARTSAPRPWAWASVFLKSSFTKARS